MAYIARLAKVEVKCWLSPESCILSKVTTTFLVCMLEMSKPKCGICQVWFVVRGNSARCILLDPVGL
jgi:hypothetical protein